MHTLIRTRFALVLALVALSASAQQPDMNLMMKWSSAEIVHYDVVAEYAGDAEILRSDESGAVYRTQVQDRVEVAFDWNQNEMKLVGTPLIRNFPSTVLPGTPKPDCPPERVTGAYEHADVTAVKGMDYNPVLQLAANRTLASGAIPWWNDNLPGGCGNAWQEASAKSEPIELGILVLPSTYLAMPAAAGGVSFGKDGKTMTTTQADWTYTYTLSTK